MNKSLTFPAIFLSLTGSAFAALPPTYLNVPGFKQCLSEKTIESYQIRCLPAKRPSACPAPSWQQLVTLEKEGKLSKCSAR